MTEGNWFQNPTRYFKAHRHDEGTFLEKGRGRGFFERTVVDLKVVNAETFKNCHTGLLDVEGSTKLRLRHAVHLPYLYSH